MNSFGVVTGAWRSNLNSPNKELQILPMWYTEMLNYIQLKKSR